MSDSGQHIISTWTSCRSDDYGVTWQRVLDLAGRVTAVHVNRAGDKVVMSENRNMWGLLSNDYFPNFSDNYGENYTITDASGFWTDFISNRNFTLVCGIDQRAGFRCANIIFYEDTEAPSATPSTTAPTYSPPTAQPSSRPSGLPSSVPSYLPSAEPSTFPSSVPTSSCPTSFPSSSFPSSVPSLAPSNVPSGVPSSSPSGEPSPWPTGEPSGRPSGFPSADPSGS